MKKSSAPDPQGHNMTFKNSLTINKLINISRKNALMKVKKTMPTCILYLNY